MTGSNHPEDDTQMQCKAAKLRDQRSLGECKVGDRVMRRKEGRGELKQPIRDEYHSADAL